jgi:hypothetical protein
MGVADMRFHACRLDPECRREGAPNRIHITGRRGGLTIGARSQAWLPFLGYLPHRWWAWWPITYHPTGCKPGYLIRHWPQLYGGTPNTEVVE